MTVLVYYAIKTNYAPILLAMGFALMLWIRYLDWIVGGRKHLWSRHEAYQPYAVRPDSPEGLKREGAILSNIEEIK